MKNLIYIKLDFHKFSIKIRNIQYNIILNPYIYEIIKLSNFEYYLRYVSNKIISLFIEENSLLEILDKYYSYNELDKCHYVDLKKLYSHNILRTMPFRIANKYLFSSIKNRKNFYRIVKGEERIRGPNDLIIYRIKLNKTYRNLIHINDLEKFELECSYSRNLPSEENSKMLFLDLDEYMPIWDINYKIYDNKLASGPAIYKYCFLNDIPIYYNDLDTFDEKEPIGFREIFRFIKKVDMVNNDIENIKNRILFKNFDNHIENNKHCFFGLEFILKYFIKCNFTRLKYGSVLKLINKFYHSNIRFFYNSNKYSYSENYSYVNIHKDDVYIIERFISQII